MVRKRSWGIILALSLIILIFPLSLSAQATLPTLDKGDLSKGLLKVKSQPAKEDNYLIRISKGSVSDDYKLIPNAAYPLTTGNGDYNVIIGELVEGNRYRVVVTEDIPLKMKDDKVVFLQATNYINWNDNSMAVVKAQELTKDVKDDREKLAIIYRYVVNNVSYDNEKAQAVKADYIPNLDTIFATNTGICYDYATMTAAMLRSVGVPTKLLMGYQKDDQATYHAWNQVFVNDEWLTIDTTYDASFIQAKQVTTMVKSDADYTDIRKVY